MEYVYKEVKRTESELAELSWIDLNRIQEIRCGKRKRKWNMKSRFFYMPACFVHAGNGRFLNLFMNMILLWIKSKHIWNFSNI